MIRRRTYAAVLLLMALTVFAYAKNAYACGPCVCDTPFHEAERELIEQMSEETRVAITDNTRKFQHWFMYDFFYDYVQKALEEMTEELTMFGELETGIVGAFLDSKQQLETQGLMQEKTAEAHRNYQTSAHFCTVGTAAIGMASAERQGTVNAIILEQRSIDRQLGNVDTVAAEGPEIDIRGRVRQFRARYCDPHYNDNHLDLICEATAVPATRSRDVDYMATMWNSLSLNLDLTDNPLIPANMTRDDQDVTALATNLYGHRLGKRQDKAVVSNEFNVEDYYDSRSVVAKRSVAENSFYALAGLKSAGTAASGAVGPYVAAALNQLGGTQQNAVGWLGGERPSYLAELEIMAQRVYQDPEFFSSLYDTPANVDRKDAAMRAINLMVGRDTFRSELRYEALLATWLELEVEKVQMPLENRIDWLDERSRKN